MYINQLDSTQERFKQLGRAADRLRRHSLVSTDKAGSGHPTSAMSCAEIVSVLFFEQMRLDPENPDNRHNDQFVLSKGHAAPVLWAAFYEAGLIDKKQHDSLREIDSAQEGHPTPRNQWVKVATGSLGQGLSMGLGMAWAARANKTDGRVYVLLGDGETAEGSVWEAAALAAHEKLDKVTAIVDINRLGQSDPTMLQHDISAYRKRFEAFGWFVSEVDGHNVGEISAAFEHSKKIHGQPQVILAATTKGRGVPSIEDEQGKHGKPAPSLEEALGELGADSAQDERMLDIRPPEKIDRLGSIEITGPLPPGDYADDASTATRAAFGEAMLALGERCPQLVALDGDVKNSTKLQDFFDRHPERSLECYIAEQNMLGMAIGMAKCGLLPCAATFAAFLTRAFDQLRMAAISRARMIVAGSHAGVAIGEDGPTQMGLEDIAMMRSLPGSIVLYPADARATHGALDQAARHDGIAYLRLNRSDTPHLYDDDTSFAPGKAFLWNESDTDQVTLVGAGITLHECLEARRELKESGIAARVVDCFSVKPVDKALLRRCAEETGAMIVVEDHYAAGGMGEAVLSAIQEIDCKWRHLAVTELSRSGAPEALLKRHGIAAESIVSAAKEMVARD